MLGLLEIEKEFSWNYKPKQQSQINLHQEENLCQVFISVQPIEKDFPSPSVSVTAGQEMGGEVVTRSGRPLLKPLNLANYIC